jgi:tetratricopeptide (TPR) repeat protein
MKKLTAISLFFMVLGAFTTPVMSAETTGYEVDAIASGDLQNAEQGLLAVLEKNPDDPYALLNLAYVYKKAGNTAKAQDTYQRILALKTNPYAELVSGKAERIKSIARRGIAQAATQ